MGEPFVEPVVLRSSGGRLDLSLNAAAATHPGAASGALAYNDSVIGPTLRLRPGDRLTIELTNNLDDATNLHTHGLAVSPTSPADDVFVSVAPGETRTYVYDLPEDHRSGLFWYHPHLHGVVATQVAAGLVGAIIVYDALDDMEEISTARERLWVLNDPTSADRAVSGMDQMHGRTGSSVMVNGASKPTFEVTAGVVERWRIVNASASRRLPFAVDGASLALIASDGGRFAEPIDVQGVVLSPGERAEVLVVPPTEAGSYQVTGDGSGGEIATLVVAEANAAAPTLPARLVDPSLFEIGAVTARRTLRFGSEMGGGMMSGGGLSFTIDGRTFDPERVDIDTVLGEIEEWTIVNDTGMDHPFHLHVWPFQIVDDTGWPGWKDTVNVPGGGQVTIRIPFVGHTGRTVYHCHILDHEDIGMMGVINVASPSR
jgi:FtsP/CotA-like multicopper oxidase with cupredoxin domain